MKFKHFLNIVVLVVITAFAAALSSCTFTEKIVIEEDGSGSYNMDMDMSQFMDFASSMKDSFDSLKVENEKPKKVIDSIINFSEILDENKDSIAQLPEEERLALEGLRDAKMKMFIDEENGKMLMNFMYDFNNFNDLEKVQNKVSKAYSLTSNKNNATATDSPTSTTYEYTSKSFKRKVVSNKLTKKELEEYKKNMSEMSMFLSGSTYQLEYHFPKKIKSTTAKNATFSDNKKVMYLTYPISDVFEDEKLLDFEVKF